jgi:hypothetical protein
VPSKMLIIFVFCFLEAFIIKNKMPGDALSPHRFGYVTPAITSGASLGDATQPVALRQSGNRDKYSRLAGTWQGEKFVKIQNFNFDITWV